MKKKWLALFVGIGIVVVLFGCSAKERPYKVKVNHNIVNTLPKSYALQFPKNRMRYINGLREVRVVVVNPTHKRYDDIEYRFKWYDRRNREVAQDFCVWQPLFIESKDQKEITALAPIPKAQRYKFYIRKRK